MRKLSLCLALALGGMSSNALAVSCGDTNRIYNLYDLTSEGLFKNGPDTIGPRRLVTRQTTKVPAFFDRQLISPTPMDIDAIHMDIKKIAGSRIGGKVSAAICATDSNGYAVKLGEVTFKGGKRNIGDVYQRTFYGVKDKRLSVHVVGQALVGSSTLDIDLKRTRNEGQPWSPSRWAPTTPIQGFADVHVHQAARLAFSKGWYWGSHMPGHLADRLPQCTGDNHGTLTPLGINLHEIANPHHNKTEGYPSYDDWPIWNDIKHQQVTAEWLKDAKDRGLKVMIASVVNNQTLAAASIASGKHDNTVAPFDMESAKLQIHSLKQMDAQEDWFEIVLDPWHARRAVSQGKLAVILSVEVSNLFPEADGPWKEQLWDLYHMGVRSVQIAHQHNNDFSGAAYHRDALEIITQLKSWFDEDIDYAKASDGVHNDIGLSSLGYQLLREMIRLDMLIDITHLPLKSQRQIYNVVKNEYNYYPLYNSHSRIDNLLRPQEKSQLREFVTTDETLEFIRATGGVLGLRTGKEPMLTYANSGVTNNCDGSVRSLAQFYRYAADRGVSTAFASDFNGFIEQLPPRFGEHACGGADNGTIKSQQASVQGSQPTGQPAYINEYNRKGLAHIGLLPAALWDLERVGADTTDLKSSAEAVVQMWDRVYDTNRSKL